MRWFPRALVIAGAGAVLATSVARPAALQSGQPPPGPAVATSSPTVKIPLPPEAFAGTWDYIPAESVNAANGRPEQAPQSATQRRNPPGSTATTRPPGQGGYGGGGGGGGSIGTGYGPGAGYGNPSGYGPSSNPLPRGPMGVNTFVLRDLARDLLEIPEYLTIKVTAESVTFTDDLNRELTFPTNGKKQRYQLAAAVFDAKTSWVGAQLEKQITAAESFKMTETYRLSEDGQRLFVIIRLGEQRKDRPVVGVNRSYARVIR